MPSHSGTEEIEETHVLAMQSLVFSQDQERAVVVRPARPASLARLLFRGLKSANSAATHGLLRGSGKLADGKDEEKDDTVLLN